MEIVKGDLIALALQGKFNVIVHGCNCFCNMNMGIAKTVKENFPEAYEADLRTKKGDRGKLGKISWGISLVNGKELVIVNAYTQFEYWGKGRKVDYDAIRSCFEEIGKRVPAKSIGMPKVGTGYGGGDWEQIYGIVAKIIKKVDLTIVIMA